MRKTLFISILLIFTCTSHLTVATEINQENDNIKLHVIQSKEIQEIMHRLSFSVYDETLSIEQINELFDGASELLLAAKKLTQALPGIDLSKSEKTIFESIARQLQIEANNLGYMAQNNDKEGMEIIYQRLNSTCAACHDLFRF